MVKHEKTIPFDASKDDPKALYNYQEAIINALRPTLKEGIRSVILASPAKSNYAKSFLNHVQSHHAWLTQGLNKVTLKEIAGSADTLTKVTTLTRSPAFRQIIIEATAEETENLVDLIEKRLNNQNTLVFYSLKEIEDLVFKPWKPSKSKPEYLLLTDIRLAIRGKSRLQRLMQIATNRNVKTRIIKSQSAAGKRITQLGGIVLLTTID